MSKDLITYSVSFKFKSRFLNNSNNGGTKNVGIALPLRYLSNFWRNLEMSLINCEINLILIWSPNCVISEKNRVTTFLIIVIINLKLLQQLKSSFQRTTNWNKYQSKVTIQRQNQYLDCFIFSNFQIFFLGSILQGSFCFIN